MSERKGTSHLNQIDRLKRIEGQVRGVISMVENERYCIDILHQMKAIQAALATVERNIADQHLAHCFEKALETKNLKKGQKMLDEVRQLLKARVK